MQPIHSGYPQYNSCLSGHSLAFANGTPHSQKQPESNRISINNLISSETNRPIVSSTIISQILGNTPSPTDSSTSTVPADSNQSSTKRQLPTDSSASTVPAGSNRSSAKRQRTNNARAGVDSLLSAAHDLETPRRALNPKECEEVVNRLMNLLLQPGQGTDCSNAIDSLIKEIETNARHTKVFIANNVDKLVDYLGIGNTIQQESAAKIFSIYIRHSGKKDVFSNNKIFSQLLDTHKWQNNVFKDCAIELLTYLAESPKYADKIDRFNGIGILIDTLQSGTDTQKAAVTKALLTIFKTLGVSKSIEPGSPRKLQLFQMLQPANEGVNKYVFDILYSTLIDRPEPNKVVRPMIQSCIPNLVEILAENKSEFNPDAADLLECLSNYDTYHPFIISAGPKLVNLLQSRNGNLKELAARVVTNLMGKEESFKPLVEAGVIPLFVKMVSAESESLLRTEKGSAHLHAIESLASLSRDFNYGQKIIDADGMPLILGLLKSNDPRTLQCTAVTLCNLMNISIGQEKIIGLDGVKSLLGLLKSPDDIVKEGALRALIQLFKSAPPDSLGMHTDDLHQLFPLLRSENNTIHQQALRFVRHLARHPKLNAMLCSMGIQSRLELIVATGPDSRKGGAQEVLSLFG